MENDLILKINRVEKYINNYIHIVSKYNDTDKLLNIKQKYFIKINNKINNLINYCKLNNNSNLQDIFNKFVNLSGGFYKYYLFDVIGVQSLYFFYKIYKQNYELFKEEASKYLKDKNLEFSILDIETIIDVILNSPKLIHSDINDDIDIDTFKQIITTQMSSKSSNYLLTVDPEYKPQRKTGFIPGKQPVPVHMIRNNLAKLKKAISGGTNIPLQNALEEYTRTKQVTESLIGKIGTYKQILDKVSKIKQLR